MFEPTVQGDTRALQRGLNRLGTARMGPVSIGPGDGHIRYYDASGRTTFRTDGAGAQVYAHGALRPLGGAIESKASQTYVDGNIATLAAKDSAQDSRMDGHDGRMNTMQSDINTRATSSWVSSALADVNAALDTKASASWVSSALAGKAAVSYVDTVNGRANAAQNRADDAYDLAAGAARPGDIPSLAGYATRQYVDQQIAQLVAAIRDAGLPIMQ